jgi:general secretion pathway protein G
MWFGSTNSVGTMKICQRPAHGFTIIELLVVMLVLGVLSALAFPMAEVTVQRDRERELKRALWEIRDAIDAYKRSVDAGQVGRSAQGSSYPPSLEVLMQGVPNAGGTASPPFFLRRLPRDPFADPSLPAAQTWGLRSYLSPPDNPQPGADVFDVYSKSERIGLNGVPLRQW